MDPYDFNNDVYVESPTPNFNDSFMDQFRSDDEEEFVGFTREEIFLGTSSRVRSFRERLEEDGPKKENVPPSVPPPAKKRKAVPST